MSVVVTGLGVHCAVADSPAALVRAAREGRSGIQPLSRFSPKSVAPLPVAQVPVLPGPDDGRPATHRLAMAAAEQALQDSRLAQRIKAERIAVVLGTTTGGIGHSETWFMRTLAGQTAPPELLYDHPAVTVAHAVADHVGAEGPCLTVSTACSSGANALLTGVDLLRAGLADVVLAGGADGLCQLPYFGFSTLRLLSPEPCRPFDEARQGLNLGEAGAFLVLERRQDAQARGAQELAELSAGATTCDAHHMTAPDPAGTQVVRAMQLALTNAGLRPEQVAYVSAHGTATPANDAAEAQALVQVFGDTMPPVSCSKSFLGHTLGAAGAVEALICVLSVKEGLLFPTITTDNPIAAGPQDLVLGAAREADLANAMSNAFAFGGNNAVLVFKRAGR